MAHKTLIGGTAYEIDGGKAMVDGTVYEIDHGVANVDGTAYEVGFGPATVTLTIDTVFGNEIYVGVNNFISTSCRYTTPTGENGTLTSKGDYEFPIGTTICIEMEYGYQKIGMAVYLNDEQVAYSNNYLSYEHTLTTNTVVSGMIDYMGGRYYITEE